jgi:hypothetical protein
MARLGLIENRDSSEVTVTVRHGCQDFTFGTALGPGNLESWWWSTRFHAGVEILCRRTASRDEYAAIGSAIAAAIPADYRRHLDELQERPEG